MKWLPNFFTFLNLCAGSIAIYCLFSDMFDWVFLLFLAALMADFLDGYFARILQAQTDIGKQLDSLADLISFGGLPFFIVLVHLPNQSNLAGKFFCVGIACVYLWATAYRLAKFSSQKEQQSAFSGLPSPAAATAVLAFFIGVWNTGDVTMAQESLLFGIALVCAVLMLSPIPMIKLQMGLNWINLLLLGCVLLFTLLLGIAGFTLAVVCYIILSLVTGIQSKQSVRK